MHSKYDEGNFKVCDHKSRKKKMWHLSVMCCVLFVFVECFSRNIPFVWVNLLCQQTHRSPNVMGIRWHLKAITIREVLQANCTLIKQDLHYKSSPQYKLRRKKNGTVFSLEDCRVKVLCWTLLQSRIEKASKSSEILICIVVDKKV